MLTDEQVRKQSEAAYKQWASQWRDHAKENSKWPQKSLKDFEYTGVGRAALCCATGASLEHNIETVRQYQDNVDVICNDKSLGILLDNGITPQMCVVCDANVDYEKYMKPWEDKLSNTIMVGNVCCNPKWPANGNWKDRYFFVLKDVLQSEKEFGPLSQCPNTMAAGTNVSNTLVVFLTQSDNRTKQNFFGYDKILLIGFDYCWYLDGHYYAFDPDAGGKHNYMRHGFVTTHAGRHACSSGNLVFSAKWLAQYIRAYNIPAVQCTRHSILATPKMGRLEQQMQYKCDPEDSKTVRDKMHLKRTLFNRLAKIDAELSDLALKHRYAYMAS